MARRCARCVASRSLPTTSTAALRSDSPCRGSPAATRSVHALIAWQRGIAHPRSTTTPSLDRCRGRGTRTTDQRRDPRQGASAPALQVHRTPCAYRWLLLPATPSFPPAVRSPLHQQVDHSREPFGIDSPVQHNAVTVRELDLDPPARSPGSTDCIAL